RILTNPAYGGAYAYGKTQIAPRYDRGAARPGTHRRPQSQWLALQPGTHEGYVDWERAQTIKRMIADNSFHGEHHGAARSGPSLLAGLLRCRRCGRRLTVSYTGQGHDVLRYTCRRGWLDAGEPRCIAFGGLAVDAAVAEEVLRVVEPGAIEAALQAARDEAHRRDDVLEALRRDHEAARYDADRARRQFDAADPENRLVTAELEARWNRMLERVSELGERIDRHVAEAPAAPPASSDELIALASTLRTVWNDPTSDARLRKRIVRTLIREIVVDIDAQAGQVVLVFHWSGGVHTERRLWRRRRGQRDGKAREAVEAVRALARICSDDLIASLLNRNRLRTGAGNWWTRERVTSLRTKRAIAVHRRDVQQAEGWMNLTQAAAILAISPKLLRIAAERGDIEAEHPLSDGPWVFNRAALATDAARALSRRARKRQNHPAGQNREQQNLFNPMASPDEAV
ncbi:MAG: hypothetical protein FJX57_03075, partial [Alphaproteobacteria bacterium]|nr:hypothetical protein [Alphaproteobacteria bacterium]